MLRAADVAEQIGFRALATHPLDAAAEGFYARFGFLAIPDSQPRLMVLARARLLAAVQACQSGE